MRNPGRLESLQETPTLNLGELGCFDDCGVMPSCIVDVGQERYMYYTGWVRRGSVPFSFYIGLCISRDGGRTYRRFSQAPVLERNIHDHLMTASPWVLREQGGWRLWYVSCTRWERLGGGGFKHYYHIRYADSEDGIHWRPDGHVCIDFREEEYAIARPVVHRLADKYVMWYCFRGGENTYRAGYAESPDGLRWERMDEKVNLEPAAEGWDSEMICYPCTFEYQGRTWMLYNGNGYGATGCGLAVRVED
jgi:hypothetical protein